MALGAQQRDVLQMIISQGAYLAVAGITGGLLLAFALSHFMKSVLFGVDSLDPATLLAVTILFAGIALLASYIPARRATRIDPMMALHYE